MSAYWFMFSIPVLMSVLPIKFKSLSNYKLLLTYTFICVLFIGFRFEVGGDWGVYLEKSLDIYSKNFTEIFYLSNVGYNVLAWISTRSGLGLIGTNVFCAAIFMIGLHKLCKTQPYPWLGYVVAFPYLITVVAMGYVRQSFTIGIAFWCFSIWQKGEKYHEIKIIILALLGITFHKISLLLLPLIFIRNKGKFINYLYTLIGVLILLLILYYFSSIEEIALYIEHYIIRSNIHIYGEDPAQTISYGVGIRMLMNIPPCLLLIYFYKNFKEFGDRRLWTIISFFSIIAFFASSYASTFVDRLGLYLISLQIVVYSRIPLFINNMNVRKLFIYTICISYILVFFVWLNYSYSSWAWIPYKFSLNPPVVNPLGEPYWWIN